MDQLVKSWTRNASPANYVAYLWAILKCFSESDRDILKSALSYWSTISEKERSRPTNNFIHGRTIDNQIKFLHWNFSDEQLRILLELSEDRDLHGILSLLFAYVDHPVAFRVVLNVEMERDTSFPRFEEWDGRWDFKRTNYRLSNASLQYLLQEFSDLSILPTRRYIAWRYWTGNQDEIVVLGQLQQIVDKNDSLFEESIFWRLSHGDITVAQEVKIVIGDKPWVVSSLDYIWTEEVKTFFSQWFAERIRNGNFSELTYGLELLSNLDNNEASQMLIAHWEKLRLHSRSILTALFLSTPETIRLADLEIKRLGFEPGKDMPIFYYGNLYGQYYSKDDLPEDIKERLLLLVEHFRYMYLHYGVKREGRPERLTREKLECLIPYLSLFDSHSNYQLALKCLSIGAVDLCFEKFYPEIKEAGLRNRIRLSPKELDLETVSKYRELENNKTVYMDFFIEQIEKSEINDEILFSSLKSFSKSYHTAKAFYIVAVILESLGKRMHIEILEDFCLDNEQDRMNVEFWKANAIFAIKRRSLN
ncbi:hypothetical protein MKQ70_22240 [Chitinophaga sedimenti]|uniref:hypothetical protein n=1 Tax=Chitinophaga sedimenti TaxID=2033606 RepID=UPI0020063948|nr:hypothetical protein [Chitinophaga sedimenti]MCK7557574.1 hypothetical protein [Chitinophaga sedimenti]